jgi:hypothetical protein
MVSLGSTMGLARDRLDLVSHDACSKAWDVSRMNGEALEAQLLHSFLGMQHVEAAKDHVVHIMATQKHAWMHTCGGRTFAGKENPSHGHEHGMVVEGDGCTTR